MFRGQTARRAAAIAGRKCRSVQSVQLQYELYKRARPSAVGKKSTDKQARLVTRQIKFVHFHFASTRSRDYITGSKMLLQLFFFNSHSLI